MPKPARCFLTAKDFTVLEVLLDRRVNQDGSFLRLLRHKLAAARVVFQEDLGPQVATINSRVEFTVDGSLVDSRILVHGTVYACPGPSLSVTTLRGLALLGMTAGETIVVERPDDRPEAISLDAVAYQPAANRRGRPRWPSPPDPAAAVEVRSPVVSLAMRRKAAARPAPWAPVDPNDDDPGPQAA